MKKKGILKAVGIILVGGLVVLSWWVGWFQVIFYFLGLYAAVYVVSYLFKTTAFANFLLSIGVVILYAVSWLGVLYALYLILTTMFTENFLLGLLLLMVLGLVGSLIPLIIGTIFIYPLAFISEDIEKRFQRNNDSNYLE